ncbi:unnamed protein product [Rodentolepis nana]|uniref:Pecanex-like protein n=1 Tax=Rodentolepis nana TaxID=102285 RepID=A0A0R3U0C5_RODNA|nr:unnamed protein product [Rodentolepis nana]
MECPPESCKQVWEYTIGLFIFIMLVLVFTGIGTNETTLFTISLLIMAMLVLLSCIVAIILKIFKSCYQRDAIEIELISTKPLKMDQENNSEDPQVADCERVFSVVRIK